MAGNWLTGIASVATDLIGSSKVDRKAIKDALGQLAAAEYNKILTIANNIRSTWRGTLDADGKHFIGLGRNATNPLTGTLLTEVGSGLYLDDAGAVWLVYNGGSPVRFGVGKTFMCWGYTNGFGIATLYVPVGTWSSPDTEARTLIKVPFNCTAKNLRVHAGTLPGTTHTIDFTVRRGIGTGAMGSTSITCQIASGTANNETADTTNTQAFVAGDSLAIQAVGAAAGTAEAYVKITLELDPT